MTTIRDAPAMRAPLTALSPTPPAPKMTTVSPACTSSGIQDGARAGDNAAAQQRRLRERHVFGHKRELVLVDERAFGEAAKSHALEQGGAVAAQARRIPRPPQRRFRVLTLEGTAGLASRARSARLHKRAHDMIADAELRDIRADLGDDSRDLVAEYRRKRSDIVRGKQKIGVTQPGRAHVDENFAPNGRRYVHILKVEASTERVNYQRLHQRLSSVRVAFKMTGERASDLLQICRCFT